MSKTPISNKSKSVVVRNEECPTCLLIKIFKLSKIIFCFYGNYFFYFHSFQVVSCWFKNDVFLLNTKLQIEMPEFILNGAKHSCTIVCWHCRCWDQYGGRTWRNQQWKSNSEKRWRFRSHSLGNLLIWKKSRKRILFQIDRWHIQKIPPGSCFQDVYFSFQDGDWWRPYNDGLWMFRKFSFLSLSFNNGIRYSYICKQHVLFTKITNFT